MLTNLLIISLTIIAAVVTYGLYRKRNMWRWVVLYWIVLTIKNVLDAIGGSTP